MVAGDEPHVRPDRASWLAETERAGEVRERRRGVIERGESELEEVAEDDQLGRSVTGVSEARHSPSAASAGAGASRSTSVPESVTLVSTLLSAPRCRSDTTR